MPALANLVGAMTVEDLSGRPIEDLLTAAMGSSKEENRMIAVYLVLVAAALGGTGFLVYRSQDFRKFLAGAFFVSAGVQFYLAWMGVSIPLAGTNAFQTPEVGWARASLHTALFLLSTYFGFIRRPKQASAARG